MTIKQHEQWWVRIGIDQHLTEAEVLGVSDRVVLLRVYDGGGKSGYLWSINRYALADIKFVELIKKELR